MKPTIFLSPPFGNYYSLILPFLKNNYTPILGSFTMFERKGLFLNTIRTLRYDHDYNGWVNNIGLCNPGIIQGIQNYNNHTNWPGNPQHTLEKNKVMSIALIDPDDIFYINKQLPKYISFELNISCPNIDQNNNKLFNSKHHINELEKFVNNNLSNTQIIKLKPHFSMKEVDILYDIGFRQFHCSNTIPVKHGGLSGKSLIQNNLKRIQDLKYRFCDDIEIIGGGGILDVSIAEKYLWAGADHLSISTICMNPFTLHKFDTMLKNNKNIIS